jgi:hypothetical protein
MLLSGRTVYGDIGAGETTGYKRWAPAYPGPKVELELGGALLRQTPGDHHGYEGPAYSV